MSKMLEKKLKAQEKLAKLNSLCVLKAAVFCRCARVRRYAHTRSLSLQQLYRLDIDDRMYFSFLQLINALLKI